MGCLPPLVWKWYLKSTVDEVRRKQRSNSSQVLFSVWDRRCNFRSLVWVNMPPGGYHLTRQVSPHHVSTWPHWAGRPPPWAGTTSPGGYLSGDTNHATWLILTHQCTNCHSVNSWWPMKKTCPHKMSAADKLTSSTFPGMTIIFFERPLLSTRVWEKISK